MVVDKPPGLLTSTAPGEGRPSVFGLLKSYAKERGGHGARAWIVHRLDKDASGLLVFAKNEKAFEWLKEDFRAKRVHRLYIAVAEGEARNEDGSERTSGTIQSFLREGPHRKMESIPSGAFRGARGPRAAAGGTGGTGGRGEDEADEGAKLAVTHYQVVAVGQGRTLLKVRLETGRKNQIRVHMTEWGHPLLGDEQYGAKSNPIGRLALHATELGFAHPTTGQALRFSSPAPASFWRAVGAKPPPNAPEHGSQTADPASAPPPAAPYAASDTRGNRTETRRLDTSWDRVADWYDDLVGQKRSDHFERVILPGALRLLRPAPGARILDIACGQGALCERLADLGAQTIGIDASPGLIESARRRGAGGGAGGGRSRFEVGDARDLDQPAFRERLGLADLDAASCIMALMNIDSLEPVLRGGAAALKEGGAFVAVVLHPAFRAPEQTSWGWEEGRIARGHGEAGPRIRKTGSESRGTQYRRVDGYLSPKASQIVMNPGKAAHGGEAVTTWTFHRPIQAYIKAFVEAGLLVEALEEWPSLRQSEPGPRAAEENRARREIPMFLGVRGVRARSS